MILRAALLALVLATRVGVVGAEVPPAPAVATAPADALAARIDAHIAQAHFAAASWGIHVVSLDSGKTLYAHAADTLFTPASTAKLFTAGLALARFGPDHRIPTSLFATAPARRDGSLPGDVVLVGYGDPMLGSDRRVSWADTLAIELRKTGVRAVEGDLIADATWFAAPLYGRGWEAADLMTWFGAPASALSVDDNVVRLEIGPAAKVGGRARIRYDAPFAAPDIDNALRTVAATDVTDISLFRAPGDTVLRAFGTVSRDAGTQTYRLAMPDPALAAGEQLRAALLRQDVRVTGKVRSIYWPQREGGPDTSKWHRIADVWSPPVAAIVERGLKVSQNLYMQNLLLLVGAQDAAEERASGIVAERFRSSEARALETMQRWLASIGIAPGSALLEDGAGLSRRNLVSPRAMTTLLVHEGSAPEAQAFRVALPEAGIDGSLTGRMRDTDAQGRVHAKTGSMNYTWSLAGYVRTKAGERLAFALMLNNYDPPAAPRAGALRPSAELDAIAVMLAAHADR
ncbi:MAG: D-alanyl-D-alanine carboxypeptidase/D-alanyl-D-alanine-endopeptidase [Xanthomonadales bacterium]|nr:D-alanyl-D-alanine carboxypeptidase/D-alanyl-D-alanine-endopeptidase [Xanthomonadales bacterium]